MNPLEMVVAVVFLGVVGSIINNLITARSDKAARREHEGAHYEAEQLRELVVALEDRIRVLERIVTDTTGRDDLRRQFRDLER